MMYTHSSSACASRRLEHDVIFVVLGIVLFFFIFGEYCLRDYWTGDEVDDYWKFDFSMYLLNGRWAIAIYDVLFDVETSAFTAGIYSALFLSIALVQSCRIFKWDNVWGCIVFMVTALGSAHFATQLPFSYQSPVVALGMLAVVNSYIMLKRYFEKKDMLSLCVSLFLLVFAMGCYQVLCMIFPVLFCGEYLLNRAEQTTRQAWREILWSAGILFVSCLVYVCFTAAVKHILFSPEAIKYINSYQDAVFKWGVVPVSHSLISVAQEYAQKLFGFPLRENGLYGLTLIPMLIWCLHIFSRSERRTPVNRLTLLAMLAVIWLLPFSMSIVIGSQAPERLYVAQAWSCGWLYASVLPLVARKCRARNIPTGYVVIVIALFVTMSASYRISKEVMQRELHWERSSHTIQRVESMIVQSGLLQELDAEKGKIYICGLSDDLYQARHASALDGGFFELQSWWALPQLSYHCVMRKYYLASEEQMQQWEAELNEMPVWPDVRSMRLLDGHIIIKMGSIKPTGKLFQ